VRGQDASFTSQAAEFPNERFLGAMWAKAWIALVGDDDRSDKLFDTLAEILDRLTSR
jgi:hypothetical protein